MMALEQAQLVRGEPELGAPRVEFGDPGEQLGVERDPHLVLRQLWRVVAGDRLKRRIGVARVEVREHPAHPVEQSPAAFESLDRVGKARRPRCAGDGRDFGQLLRHAAVESRGKMIRPNAVERRDAERRLPGLEKRVFSHLCLGAISVSGPSLSRGASEGCSSNVGLVAARVQYRRQHRGDAKIVLQPGFSRQWRAAQNCPDLSLLDLSRHFLMKLLVGVLTADVDAVTIDRVGVQILHAAV